MYVFHEDMNALVALEASNDFTLSFSIPGMPTETNFLLVNGVTYGKAERGGTLISLRPWEWSHACMGMRAMVVLVCLQPLPCSGF